MSDTASPQRALGRQPAVYDPNALELRAVGRRLDPPPTKSNWYAEIGDWPMLGNDTIGDCLPVACLHLLQQRRGYLTQPWTPTTQDARNLYKQWNKGWNSADPKTDTGCLLSSSLRDWAVNGIRVPWGVDKPEAYAYVDHLSLPWIKTAIHRFGHCILGIDCPTAWLESNYLLDLPGDPGEIAGGHGVLLTGYEPTALGDEMATITWGGRFVMTARALEKVTREAFVVMDWDFYDEAGHDPAGFDRKAAEQVMANLVHGRA